VSGVLKRIVIGPDIQAPLHDVKLVERFTDFLRVYKPDGLALVGDVSDSTEISRWAKGYKEEHGDLQRGLDQTHDILAGFRKAVGKQCPIDLERSNHDERSENYIRQYAPGLASLRALDLPSLLGLGELDITYRRSAFAVAPNTLVMHGDEGGLSSIAGQTAFKLASGAGKNVCCGHTHRAGIRPFTEAVAGKVTRTYWGMEVGHFMDLKKASYLKSGGANWQQAFGLLYVEGQQVTPSLVLVRRNGSFIVEGKAY
jgi:hypothetical protein